MGVCKPRRRRHRLRGSIVCDERRSSPKIGVCATMAAIYVATAVSSGAGRDGHVETADGRISLDLAYPRELGGTGAGSNPEQLVAMAYAACFSGALSAAARKRMIALPRVEVTCSVSLHRLDGADALSFDIVAHLPGLQADQADSLIAEARASCPCSKAFAGGAPAQARADVGP
jgi:lipoyl-dependent peroxiredoxin